MPDVNEVINGLEMSYKYSNVDENNTLVPQWIVLHALALLKAQGAVDAIPVEWLRDKMRGYASSLKSTEMDAVVRVMQMWQKEQEGARWLT